jgi:hypothetical protein
MKSGDWKSKQKRPSARKKGEKPGSDPAGRDIFCTECGATLENFCFSSAAEDLDAVRKTLAQCRQQGRFSGDFCSKLFIAHPEALSDPDAGSDDDPGA